MKLLIDANIILDVLQAREPHWRDSSLIWKLCETNITEGFISTLSFANLVYVLRKELSPEQVETVLDNLRAIFHFTELNEKDLKTAAAMHWADFEDALQAAAAARIHADYIITRNVRDFLSAPVPAIQPSELISKVLKDPTRIG